MLMTTDGTQVKSSQILSGRLTRKLVNENSSSSAPECYHAGVRVTVPFIWESEPGTPKHKQVKTSASLPPLTPPPSYFIGSTTTTPVRRHSTKLQLQSNNNSVFSKFSFTRSRSAARHSSSSENSIGSLSSVSSASPSVLSFQMTPLCDYYYSRRYGFAFEAEKGENIRSSSSSLSPFACFGSKKCTRKNNAWRSEERCSSVVRKFLPRKVILNL